MTKDERSVLLYLETCAVDRAGRVNALKMNADDVAIVDRWVASGYVKFGRIAIDHHNSDGGQWVRLSPQAMVDAHAERTARAERMWSSRTYRTTDEGK